MAGRRWIGWDVWFVSRGMSTYTTGWRVYMHGVKVRWGEFDTVISPVCVSLFRQQASNHNSSTPTTLTFRSGDHTPHDRSEVDHQPVPWTIAQRYVEEFCRHLDHYCRACARRPNIEIDRSSKMFQIAH